MAKLGEDVYEWNVDKLVFWLQAEGLNDCVRTFAFNKIDGCKLLNLSEAEIKGLHVSVESKRRLLKAVERFHKRKKEKLGRMFGGDNQVQRVAGKKPTSISHDEGASDDEGWDSEEWDSGSAGGESSSDDAGEYLEPEDDLSKPQFEKKPFERETAPIQSGLVAQLKQGIAQSLMRNTAPPQEVYEDDGDIYDLPPEEDIEEDLYEEPSDSSGGAVVVRPPPKPPRTAEDDDTYLPMTEEQDMYEAPMEGEDISPVHSASRQNNFIPTKVAQGKNFVNVPTMNNNTETYEVPDMDDEVNYEIPETGTEVPPPRPPKSNVKPAHASQGIPTRPPKQVTPSSKATVGRPPPQENSMPQPKRALSKHGTPFQLPQQTSPTRHPKPNTLTQQNRPNTLPKQLSPSHIAKSNPLSNNLSPQKSPTHHPRPATQGPPLQPKASTAQPKLTPQPSEEKRPALAPKVSPRPKPLADPAKRGPAPSPGSEPHRKTSGPPSSPQKSSAPVSPPVNQIVRKVSGPKFGPPDSPQNESSAFKKAPLPGPPVTGERPLPRPTPRGGLLSQREVPSVPGPELPQKSSSGPPLPSGRRPVPSFPENQPSVPEPSPTEATPPPRPPKHGSSAQPSLPARHSQKSAPLPVPPSERKSAPLPAPPSDKRGLPPPPMNSHPSKSPVSREQSSGSSIESGSADEPVVSFGPKKTPTRGLPQLPPTPQEKGPLDAMKEAPWFHGAVDRKKSEVNLQSTKMDGAFLVRNSTKNPNDYSLSLLYKGNIRHLKLPKKDGQYVLGASGVQRFDSIIDLINYYRVHEVDLVSGGKTKLTIHAQNIAR